MQRSAPLAGLHRQLGVTGHAAPGAVPRVARIEVEFAGEDAAALSDDLVINLDTDTAAVISGVAAGDTYRLTSVATTTLSLSALLTLTPGSSDQPRLENVPEGLSALLDTVEQIKQSVNPELAVSGILRTMYDKRTSLTREVDKQLRDFFGDALLKTTIPRNVKVAEAPSHGVPVTQYARFSRGSQAYRVLAKEMIRRLSL